MSIAEIKRKVELGIASEEERRILKIETDILSYRESKKAATVKKTVDVKSKPSKPEPPKIKKTADMKAYMANYRCEHRAEINAARNARYKRNSESEKAYQKRHNLEKKMREVLKSNV